MSTSKNRHKTARLRASLKAKKTKERLRKAGALKRKRSGRLHPR